MAANFWESSHCNKWLRTKEEVTHALSKYEQWLTVEEVQKIQVHYSKEIQIIVQAFGLKNRVFGTAVVYFKRFYLNNSWVAYDPALISAVVVYIASKVEECHNSLSANKLVKKIKRNDPSWPYSVEDVLAMEYPLLEELDFSLIVFHPYRSLVTYLSDAKQDKLLQTAWYLVNDSYRTDLCLLYPPYMISLSCIYMAAVLANENMLQWFSQLNVDMREIAAIVQEMLNLYSGWTSHCPNQDQALAETRTLLCKLPEAL
eukprot:GCRY01005819.1.p1 GENE.GCRY01005819.1~~GCRY01005819.1.p1  ORF type:complete len:258 (-),score=30.74 GCRY01005819.1:252-1025(-)